MVDYNACDACLVCGNESIEVKETCFGTIDLETLWQLVCLAARLLVLVPAKPGFRGAPIGWG